MTSIFSPDGRGNCHLKCYWFESNFVVKSNKAKSYWFESNFVVKSTKSFSETCWQWESSAAIQLYLYNCFSWIATDYSSFVFYCFFFFFFVFPPARFCECTVIFGCFEGCSQWRKCFKEFKISLNQRFYGRDLDQTLS
jgi:hypothetical protein